MIVLLIKCVTYRHHKVTEFIFIFSELLTLYDSQYFFSEIGTQCICLEEDNLQLEVIFLSTNENNIMKRVNNGLLEAKMNSWSFWC